MADQRDPLRTPAEPRASAAVPQVPPPYRDSATDGVGGIHRQDSRPTNRLLIAGSLLGLSLPAVVSLLGYLSDVINGYPADPAVFTGYLGTTRQWSALIPQWYGQYFAVSSVGIFALLACGSVLIAALTRAGWARPLALVVAPILLLLVIADGFGTFQWTPYNLSGWVVTVVTLMLELAIPILIFVGAVRPAANAGGSAFAQGALATSEEATSTSNVPTAGQTGPTDGLAIAALVLAIVGLVTCLAGSIVGLVLGYVSRSQIRQSRGAKGGAGLATASIVIGWVGIALAVVVAVAYAALVQPTF